MCLDQAGMFQCENGHTVCIDHLTEEDKLRIEQPFKNKEEFIQELLKLKEKYADDEYWLKGVNELISEITDDNWEDVMRDDYIGNFTDGPNYGVSSLICPLCNFTSITDHDAKNYLLKALGQTKEQLIEILKNRFKTYDEFQTFIKG